MPARARASAAPVCVAPKHLDCRDGSSVMRGRLRFRRAGSRRGRGRLTASAAPDYAVIAMNPLETVDIESLDENRLNAVIGLDERRTLEFKLTLPGHSSGETKEFLADVSSLANTVGGDILNGVRERQGIATAIEGVQISNVDAECRRLEQKILSGLDPRIQCRVHSVSLAAGGYVLVIRVTRSWNAPVMVKFEDSSRFHARTSRGKYRMDRTEIQSAFRAADSLAERIERFRSERLMGIVAAGSPMHEGLRPVVVLHVVPFAAFDRHIRPDWPYSASAAEQFDSLGYGGSWRFNADGRLLGSSTGYLQVFRNGVVETATTHMAHGENRTLPARHLEDRVIASVLGALRAYRHWGIGLPALALLSLLRVRGYHLIGRGDLPTDHPCDRDQLFLPDVVIDEESEGLVGQALKPVFDAMWNAFGVVASQSYGHEGQRLG